MALERQPAIKITITALLGGTYIEHANAPNCLVVGDKEVFRANIIGVITSKEQAANSPSPMLRIDDGTGRVILRAFDTNGLLDAAEIGSMINVIGRPRAFSGEVFIVPEILRKIEDPRWIEVRKRELSEIWKDAPSTRPNAQALRIEEERVIDDAMKKKIDDQNVFTADPGIKNVSAADAVLQTIRELDAGNGADSQAVITGSGIKDAEKIIDSLLKNGSVFFAKPGLLKTLD